jgi:putative Holliday junction resolvase
MTAARTFLGFDFGEKFIGVAVGSDFTRQAQPAATVPAHAAGPDWGIIDRLVSDWRPAELVVGLPLNMDDSPNRLTRAARRFGNELKARYNLPVHMVDERLTTLSAKRDLYDAGIPARHHKQHLDRLAAQAILQSFLNDLPEFDRGQDS